MSKKNNTLTIKTTASLLISKHIITTTGIFDFMVIDNTKCHHDFWVSNIFPHKCTMVCFIAIVNTYSLI